MRSLMAAATYKVRAYARTMSSMGQTSLNSDPSALYKRECREIIMLKQGVYNKKEVKGCFRVDYTFNI